MRTKRTRARSRGERRHPEDGGKNERDPRSEFQRDRDRILYSAAFRRLAEVTQVVSPAEGYRFHNRLTHSLKAAQVARRAAERLLRKHRRRSPDVGLDPDVVEAAALAHDLGHPPFGHAGEQELDALIRGAGVQDGFEGNAQSFRIVTKLAVRDENAKGLNLTRATLDALLKYPYLRKHGQRKFGAYMSEKEDLEFARQLHGSGNEERGLEAELVDWADDVTYAIHDVEDFFRAGLLPLDRVQADERVYGEFLEGVKRRNRVEEGEWESFQRVGERIKALFFADFKGPFTGTVEEEARLRVFVSKVIERQERRLELRQESGKWRLLREKEWELELAFFKELTWQFVIESPYLETAYLGQRRVVREVFEAVLERVRGGAEWILPTAYRRFCKEDGEVRAVGDFVASLSERELITWWKRVRGGGFS